MVKRKYKVESAVNFKIEENSISVLRKQKQIVNECSVSFFKLFKFTNAFDKFIILLMLLSSLGIGIAFPMNIVIFKDVIDIMVNPAGAFTFSEALLPLIINFGILASATFICGFIQMICIAFTGDHQSRSYRREYFSALLRQEIGWFDVNQTGELMTKMTDDIESIEIAIADKLAQFVQLMTSFIASVIFAMVSGWKLTLAGCIAAPLICITFVCMVHFIKKYSISQIRAYALAGGIAEEILSGIRTVVAFNAQEKEVKRYSNNLFLAEKYGIKRAICLGIGTGMIGFSVFSIGSLVFYLGIEFVINGTYSAGMVFQVFFTIVIGSIALGNATPMIENFMVAKAAASPIFDVIERKPKIDYDIPGVIPESFDGDIHFKNVYFEYPARAGVPILKDFTFTIPKGKTVAFVGPSGSGKSTIINLLQRFYDPISGAIFLNNVNLKNLDLKWYRSHIAVVQQEPPLFTGTVADNIKLGKVTANFEQILKAAKDANAYEFIMQTKEQFDTVLGDMGAGFSGGQKQRIAIATALVREPHILLLDEATSALDNKSERLVQSTIDRTILSGNKTVVMVAHRLETVKNADIIVVMQNGEILEKGNHSELVIKRGLYFEMTEIQGSSALSDDEDDEIELDEKNVTSDISRRRLSSVTLPEGVIIYEKLSKFQVLKDFIRVMKFNKPEMFTLTVGIVAATFVGAVFPCASLIYSEMYKIFSYHNNTHKMYEEGHFFCGLMLLPALVLLIAQFLKNSCLGKAGEALTTSIRSKLMEAMLRQEMAWFDKLENKPGILTGRLALEASLVKGTAGLQLSVFIEAFINVVLSMVIGFYFSWMLTLLFFIFIPFITFSGIVQGNLSSNNKLSGQESIQSSSLIMETLNNIRTVQSLSLQNHFSENFFKSLNKKKSHKWLNLCFYGIVSGLGVSAIYYAYCLVFYVGAILIDNKKIEMIQLMRVFSCLTMSSAALGRALALSPDAEKARLATRRTLETLDRVTTIDANRGAIPAEKLDGNIEFKNIYFRYPSRMNVPVLRGFNLKIAAGQTVALVGHSGCGKSTLIQLIERYYDPLQPLNRTFGQILLDGNDLKSLSLCWVRSQLGLVKQEPSLFNLTVAENISYGSKTITNLDGIQHAAKLANIHDFIEGLPERYNTKVGQRGGHLSGGQKQRICIARALYNNPSILLLDEATSALDTESEKMVQAALDNAQNNCTCIIIAHRLSTIRNADTIVVIDHGNVLECGTHDELIKKKGLYFELNSQNIN